MSDKRKRIGWCHECGNVSVDGLNFSEAPSDDGDLAGYLECARCGAVGPFAYIHQASLVASVERTQAEWPLKS
jgi:hypothetical protein